MLSQLYIFGNTERVPNQLNAYIHKLNGKNEQDDFSFIYLVKLESAPSCAFHLTIFFISEQPSNYNNQILVISPHRFRLVKEDETNLEKRGINNLKAS